MIQKILVLRNLPCITCYIRLFHPLTHESLARPLVLKTTLEQLAFLHSLESLVFFQFLFFLDQHKIVFYLDWIGYIVPPALLLMAWVGQQSIQLAIPIGPC